MTKLLRIPLLLAICSFWGAISPAHALTTLKDMTFETTSDDPGTRVHGYVLNSLRVTNISPQRRRVKIIAPDTSYSYNSGIESITRAFSMAPRATVDVSLPCPAFYVSGSAYAKIIVNGKNIGIVPVPSLNNYTFYGPKTTSLLTSRAIEGQKLEDQLQKSPKMKTYSVTRSEFEVTAWPTDWLGYTSYDAVVLHFNDLASLPGNVINALHHYVEAGGTLIITQATTLPFDWTYQHKSSDNKSTIGFCGFGQVLLLKESDIARLGADTIKLISHAADDTRRPWDVRYSTTEANKKFPVTSNIHFPVRGIFMIMLLFAIIIGPVTMIILSRKNHRIWLLWIAPAASLSVCILIFIYSLLSEGVTPTIRTLSVTMLDQTSHHAITLSVLGIYSPLTPSKGLSFSRQNEISPMLSRNSSGTSKAIDWTINQHLVSGWVSARIPAFYLSRLPQTRRERLEVITKNGKPEAVNGLGADIKQLWLRDKSGKWFSIRGSLKNGTKAVLVESKPPPSAPRITLRSIYSAYSWIDSIPKLAKNGTAILQPNMYFAELDGAPFTETGLSGNIQKKQQAYIIGIMPDIGNL